MWNYEKRLQYPVKITKPNAKIAQIILSQYGGPDGEMGASMRYLSQRYSMPDRRVMGVLTDVGTEELAHRCWMWFYWLLFQRYSPFPKIYPNASVITGKIKSHISEVNVVLLQNECIKSHKQIISNRRQITNAI